jgi:hypothetical protein
MSQFKSRFSLSTLALSMLVAGSIELICRNTLDRAPSSADDGIELSINAINLPNGSIFKGGKELYLRATINGQQKIEWSKDQAWSLAQGEKKPLDIHMKLENSWMQNDQLEFKLEVVSKGGIVENVAVRCAQIAKQISLYNRNYTCSVPGDASPLLTYRIGRKLDEATLPVAQN